MDIEEKVQVPEAKSLRWVANMLGGVDQEKGFPRTAAFYCQTAADLIERQQACIAELEAQPTNEPLTLEEMQKGDVVWIKDLVTGEIECLRFDRIEAATYHSGDDYRFEQFGTDVGIIRWACKYGINWIAYRRPPERSENE